MVLSLFLSAVASIASTLTQCDVSRQNSGASQIDVYTHMVSGNMNLMEILIKNAFNMRDASLYQYCSFFYIVHVKKKYMLKRNIDFVQVFWHKIDVREGSRYQIEWILGKIPNGLWPTNPLSHIFRKLCCIFFRKRPKKALNKGPKSANIFWDRKWLPLWKFSKIDLFW